MNTNIRKDSKVSAHTKNNVLILGVVSSVHGSHITVTTTGGTDREVLKATATKLSAMEFKTMVLEASQPVKKVIDPVKTSKKVVAIEIFNANLGAKRKEVISQFMKNGMSVHCASTYFQNIKSGKWV